VRKEDTVILQIVAVGDNLGHGGTVPVLAVNGVGNDCQSKRSAGVSDVGIDLEIRWPEISWRAATSVLDGCLALLDVVIDLRVSPGEHMLM